MPLSGEMTTTVSSLTRIFGFTCWHFCYCYLMAPLHLCTEADSQGSFGPEPSCTEGPVEFDTCVVELQRLSPQVPRREPGREVGVPPTPHHHCFSYRVPIFFCAPCLPTYPEATEPPLHRQ